MFTLKALKSVTVQWNKLFEMLINYFHIAKVLKMQQSNLLETDNDYTAIIVP